MTDTDPARAVDLAFDRSGPVGAPAVVLLHGWPGDRTDWASVSDLLAADHDVVVPDLRGFGASYEPGRDDGADPAASYGASPQAGYVARLVESLGLEGPVVAGYDVGSRVAQALAREHPEQVRALVLTPPVPGVGRRVLEPEPQREFWYQAFHQLALAEQLLDGDERAVRAYLRHFWSHWSGPALPDDLVEAQLDHLAPLYARPGAFTASVGWYRAGSGTIARAAVEDSGPRPAPITVPTTVQWPEHDPLFPPAWSDRLGETFADHTLEHVPGVGHFAPVEYPDRLADAIRAAAR
ncbi:alpha/beta fold hydrolase [Lapillicoccus jejuensis]|uniref:Pimeloyl-ACP methyl ester carboxylesterase n=1 Tax=Lapillicoccus jejuensis TaxID=402171 RepID=A0A542DVS0_9MICO|nr:alpha/beta hydrolase [Lapillicoccus jejuensis]TQJ07200.1 pimeloyl-ACP methyl ester carboxylesterase [Lapillicoccus jejuensis]